MVFVGIYFLYNFFPRNSLHTISIYRGITGLEGKGDGIKRIKSSSLRRKNFLSCNIKQNTTALRCFKLENVDETSGGPSEEISRGEEKSNRWKMRREIICILWIVCWQLEAHWSTVLSIVCESFLTLYCSRISMMWMQSKAERSKFVALSICEESFIRSKRLNVNKAGKIRALWWWCLTCCKRKCKDRGRKLSALHCSASVDGVERESVCLYVHHQQSGKDNLPKIAFNSLSNLFLRLLVLTLLIVSHQSETAEAHINIM